MDLIIKDTLSGPQEVDLTTEPDEVVAKWMMLGKPEAVEEMLRRHPIDEG